MIFFLGLLVLPLTTHAQSFEIKYSASNDHVSAGSAYWTLTQEESAWTMRLTTAPNRLARVAGVRKFVETAVLASPEPPFKAISFNHTNSKRKSKNFSATVNKDRNKIVVERPDQTLVVPINEGTIIDRLSVTLTVAAELETNPQFETLSYKVLDKHGARDMVFNNLGIEKVKFKKRVIEAYIVESRRPGSSRTTRTWFSAIDDSAANGRLLPIKIEQYKKAKLVLRLTLSKFKAL